MNNAAVLATVSVITATGAVWWMRRSTDCTWNKWVSKAEWLWLGHGSITAKQAQDDHKAVLLDLDKE